MTDDVNMIETIIAVFKLKPSEAGACEHGVPVAEWCKPCNVEYKRAATDPSNS